jgi:chromosome partitioning protein
MKTVAFFNNKGGVGKTSLTFHLAWTFADCGLRVVVADLDPQSNLSAYFIDEGRLEELWPEGRHPDTVFGYVQPLLREGGVGTVHLEDVGNRLWLIPGDLALSEYESELSSQWNNCLSESENTRYRAFLVTCAFSRMIETAGRQCSADIALIDVGPNMGAINRSALIAADHVVVPLAPDMFSIQGLRNLGPTLRMWRTEWQSRRAKAPDFNGWTVPGGHMQPIGYIVMRHAIRLDRPVKVTQRWIDRMPGEYQRHVLELSGENGSRQDDGNRIATLKDYYSLMPMAHESNKPIFHLTQADGAMGSHFYAAQQSGVDFRGVARSIADRIGVIIP